MLSPNPNKKTLSRTKGEVQSSPCNAETKDSNVIGNIDKFLRDKTVGK